MDLYMIVMKLNGPVFPTGDSSVDQIRFINLKSLTMLIDRLLFDVAEAATNQDRPEASMKTIGVYAREFLKAVKEE